MDSQNFLTAFDIRQADGDVAVETARTHQRRVQNVRTVGGRNDHNAVVVGHTVHFHQQLVQGLLAFVIAAAHAGTALAAHGIDFVNEQNAGCILLGVAEHVTDTAGTGADEHFHKVRTGNGEERDIGFTSNGFGQQGFPVPGGPTISTPLGMWAPISVNFCGERR